MATLLAVYIWGRGKGDSSPTVCLAHVCRVVVVCFLSSLAREERYFSVCRFD